jgi:hypothetical protein
LSPSAEQTKILVAVIMEVFLVLAVRVLFLNLFGWIWQCCNTDGAAGEFKIAPSAWGWSVFAALMTFAGGSGGAYED